MQNANKEYKQYVVNHGQLSAWPDVAVRILYQHANLTFGILLLVYNLSIQY